VGHGTVLTDDKMILTVSLGPKLNVPRTLHP
jgi:hypothetical protein